MKKIITYIALGLAVAFGATSCSQDNTPVEGKGEFALKVLFDDQTRATAEELAENCTINIYNSEGLIRTYNGVEAMPSMVPDLVKAPYLTCVPENCHCNAVVFLSSVK